eukprot:7844216-Ditylum_brightwellii.AAC.1
MSRIVDVEKRMHSDGYKLEFAMPLPERLTSLELSMDLESEGDMSIEERVSVIEKSFDQRVMDLEDD